MAFLYLIEHNYFGSAVKRKKKSAFNAGTAGDLGLTPGGEDPLKESSATHFGILGWRIPWTEEPGGLQSMGLQRVGHKATLHICT